MRRIVSRPNAACGFRPSRSCRCATHAREAIALVEKHFREPSGRDRNLRHPGDAGRRARLCRRLSFRTRLSDFGPYEDAMLTGQARLYHSRLSAAINVGLLHPARTLPTRGGSPIAFGRRAARIRRRIRAPADRLARIRLAELLAHDARVSDAQRTRRRPSASGVLPRRSRRIWRASATRIGSVRELGWAHHIVRLMILGNFALIAGIDPQATTDWFWYMFVDGYDWVMVPNVIGMTLHADGGLIGTKPYAASANYIDKMSDYCGGCRYDAKKATGDGACPYNSPSIGISSRGTSVALQTIRAWRSSCEIGRGATPSRKDRDPQARDGASRYPTFRRSSLADAHT